MKMSRKYERKADVKWRQSVKTKCEKVSSTRQKSFQKSSKLVQCRCGKKVSRN